MPRFRDIAGFLVKTAPHPYSAEFLVCSPWTRLPMLSEDPKPIIHVITFRLTQHIRPTGHQHHGQTDRVTDGRTDDLL